jgi:phosphopantothenoylcysteine synthetase/decarboxylase
LFPLFEKEVLMFIDFEEEYYDVCRPIFGEDAFAALIDFAKEKIEKKNCDYLIANDISRTDIGFSSDYNEVYIFDKNKKMYKENIQKNSFTK